MVKLTDIKKDALLKGIFSGQSGPRRIFCATHVAHRNMNGSCCRWRCFDVTSAAKIENYFQTG